MCDFTNYLWFDMCMFTNYMCKYLFICSTSLRCLYNRYNLYCWRKSVWYNLRWYAYFIGYNLHDYTNSLWKYLCCGCKSVRYNMCWLTYDFRKYMLSITSSLWSLRYVYNLHMFTSYLWFYLCKRNVCFRNDSMFCFNGCNKYSDQW